MDFAREQQPTESDDDKLNAERAEWWPKMTNAEATSDGIRLLQELTEIMDSAPDRESALKAYAEWTDARDHRQLQVIAAKIGAVHDIAHQLGEAVWTTAMKKKMDAGEKLTTAEGFAVILNAIR